MPVSFPVSWDALDGVHPSDFTVRTALDQLRDPMPWLAGIAPQQIPADLLEEGHTIPVARVQAMHEGKRRKRAREQGETA
ncbi:hypothetical protein JMUB6875_48200 [Nocardia sp. JMUB6875]